MLFKKMTLSFFLFVALLASPHSAQTCVCEALPHDHSDSHHETSGELARSDCCDHSEEPFKPISPKIPCCEQCLTTSKQKAVAAETYRLASFFLKKFPGSFSVVVPHHLPQTTTIYRDRLELKHFLLTGFKTVYVPQAPPYRGFC